MGSLEKELKGILSSLSLILPEVGKQLMDSEPIISETALWYEEWTAQNNTMDGGASEDKALLSISPIHWSPWTSGL